MEIRRLASFAVLLLAASPVILSQTLAGSDPTLAGSDAEQGDCADPSSASSGCAQALQQKISQAQSQQMGGSSLGRSNSLGASGADEDTSGANEAATASNGSEPRNRAQKPTSPLPPDQPTEFQRFVAATTGQLLSIYGHDLFRNVPSTFAPNNTVPVTADYVIGPEDELRIRIWG